MGSSGEKLLVQLFLNLTGFHITLAIPFCFFGDEFFLTKKICNVKLLNHKFLNIYSIKFFFEISRHEFQIIWFDSHSSPKNLLYSNAQQHLSHLFLIYNLCLRKHLFSPHKKCSFIIKFFKLFPTEWREKFHSRNYKKFFRVFRLTFSKSIFNLW